MDKSLILRQIKTHLGYKKEVDFAEFLGIKPQTLNSWYTRNTFDYEVLYAKCGWINPHWLLTGTGEMIKHDDLGKQHNMASEPHEHYGKKNTEANNPKDLIIETQQKLIISLQRNIELLEEKLRVERDINVKASSTQKMG